MSISVHSMFFVMPNAASDNMITTVYALCLYVLNARTSGGAVSVTHGGKQLCYWKVFSGCAGPPIRLTPSSQPEVTPAGLTVAKM